MAFFFFCVDADTGGVAGTGVAGTGVVANFLGSISKSKDDDDDDAVDASSSSLDFSSCS